MKKITTFSKEITCLLVSGLMLMTLSVKAQSQLEPEVVIENRIQAVLEIFVSQRAELEADKRKLYQLVEEYASPLFDFDYISKLVLAKNWKTASEQQRADFAREFERLLVVTYATALFQYSGDERMIFENVETKERKGALFAKVESLVILGKGGAPISVEYAMVKKEEQDWKIYNLVVAGLNMALNYRKVIDSSVRSNGMDGMIQSLKENNDKNY